MSHAEIQVGKFVIKIKNTNPLTAKLDIILSKTGFTNPAGGCISMMIGHNKMRRTIILLGSKNTHTRIIESLKMYNESIS
jgi:D-alanyl-D-alanine carboxypeptidase